MSPAESLMNFTLVKLVATIRLESDLPPGALFGVKSVFAQAFRRATGCITAGGGCGAGIDCPCRQTFGQQVSPDPEAVRRYQKPPLPFVFSFPAAAARQGETVPVGLVLVGQAANHLPAYLTALRQLFLLPELRRRVRGTLCSVVSSDLAGTCHELLSADGRTTLDRVLLLSAADLTAPATGGQDFILNLRTPLRLLRDGRPLRQLAAPALMGALFRRISALAYYYGEITLPHDFKSLALLSQELLLTAGSCQWTDWGSGVQGLLGRFTLGGDLDDFLPFLLLGELLHVGKGASYGMGEYSLGPFLPH